MEKKWGHRFLPRGGAPVVDRSFPLKPVRPQIRPAQRATSTTALVRI